MYTDTDTQLQELDNDNDIRYSRISKSESDYSFESEYADKKYSLRQCKEIATMAYDYFDQAGRLMEFDVIHLEDLKETIPPFIKVLKKQKYFSYDEKCYQIYYLNAIWQFQRGSGTLAVAANPLPHCPDLCLPVNELLNRRTPQCRPRAKKMVDTDRLHAELSVITAQRQADTSRLKKIDTPGFKQLLKEYLTLKDNIQINTSNIHKLKKRLKRVGVK